MSTVQDYFTAEIKEKTEALLGRYETKRATVLEVLRLLMEVHGHITLDMEKAVAEYLEIPAIDVREVVTFYTLYYTKPKAKTRLNICRTLSCALRGSTELIRYTEEKMGIKSGGTTEDGKFGLQAVECLGACEIAPMLQINDKEFIGNLTKEKIDQIIEKKPEGDEVTENQL